MRSGVTSTDQTLFLQTMTKHMFSRWLNLYNFQSLPYRSRSSNFKSLIKSEKKT